MGGNARTYGGVVSADDVLAGDVDVGAEGQRQQRRRGDAALEPRAQAY